jgi:hypothetical protein
MEHWSAQIKQELREWSTELELKTDLVKEVPTIRSTRQALFLLACWTLDPFAS